MAAGATGLAAALLAPNVLWPYIDPAVFATIGAGLLSGDLPYRDLWDHKPPAIYVVTAAATLLPGGAWPVFWALSVACIAATAVVLRSIVGGPVALLAAGCIALYPAALGGGYTETFGTLPAAVAVLLGARGRPMLAGIFAAVSVLFSVQFLPVVVALLVLGRPVRYVLGVGVVFLGTAVTLAAAGILPAAWDALVVYSLAYNQLSGARDPAWQMLLVVAPVATTALLRGTWALDRVERVAAVWLLLGLMATLLQARHFGHYATPLVIPTAILGMRAGLPALRASAAVLAAAIVTTAFATPFPQIGPATTAVGNWIKVHTKPTDEVLVWGVEANVYLVAERSVAGRYPYLLPLVTPGYSTQEQVNQWVADLDQDPPEVIVDAEAAVAHWPEDDDFLRPPPPGAAGGRTLDLLDPFRAWVLANYRFEVTIYGREIYVRVE